MIPLKIFRKKKNNFMEIRKKVRPEYFAMILAGKKKVELRLADFEIQEGDTFILEEYAYDDGGGRKPTGREIRTIATYIIKTKDFKMCPQEEIDKFGFQVIQFEIDK